VWPLAGSTTKEGERKEKAPNSIASNVVDQKMLGGEGTGTYSRTTIPRKGSEGKKEKLPFGGEGLAGHGKRRNFYLVFRVIQRTGSLC